jgi:hypothetical protein
MAVIANEGRAKKNKKRLATLKPRASALQFLVSRGSSRATLRQGSFHYLLGSNSMHVKTQLSSNGDHAFQLEVHGILGLLGLLKARGLISIHS